MKKLATLLLVSGMAFANADHASAVDIKADGSYAFQYTRWQYAGQYLKNGADRNSDSLVQRVRIGLTASLSENLSSYFQIESKWEWGNTDTPDSDNWGASSFVDGAKTGVGMRQAYLDWTIPGTEVKVRMGRQDLSLPVMPTGKNSAIWEENPADGIAISSPVTDWLSLSGFWARYSRNKGYDIAQSAKNDVITLIADMKFEGFSITPYYAYASIGNEQQLELVHNIGALDDDHKIIGRGNAHWIGFASSFNMFDPLNLEIGALWGIRTFNGNKATIFDGSDSAGDPIERTENHAKKQSGWTLEGKLSYKTPYGIPSLTMWYGSGDKRIYDNHGKAMGGKYIGMGMLPAVAGRNKISNTFFNGYDTEDSNTNNYNGLQGTWGARLAMSDISFLTDLTHEVAVIFAKGTNHSANAIAGIDPHLYLTTKDKVFEFDLNTKYEIYKNLSLLVELGYVVEDFNNTLSGREGRSYRNGWRGALELDYEF